MVRYLKSGGLLIAAGEAFGLGFYVIAVGLVVTGMTILLLTEK